MSFITFALFTFCVIHFKDYLKKQHYNSQAKYNHYSLTTSKLEFYL